MIVCYSKVEMPPSRQSSRIDTIRIKSQIVRKLGNERAEKYFHHLQRFLSFKISKREFDKLCFMTIGREHITLHNRFLVSILKNASLGKVPPANLTKEEGSSNVKVTNVHSGYLQSQYGDVFPSSPRKGRLANAHDPKFVDNLSPAGPFEKIGTSCDESISKVAENAHVMANSSGLRRHQEHRFIGSKAPVEVASVEDGEEVEQALRSPCIQSRSPVRAPLGISIGAGCARRALRNSLAGVFHLPTTGIPHTCYSSFELPDARTLRERLERKLEAEGLKVSVDCVKLLNDGLDSYLKRLIKPCMEIGRARCSQEQIRQVDCKLVPGINGVLPDRYVQRSNNCFSTSLLDFRVAMGLNPQLLGEDWPVKLEKICFYALEK